MFWVQDGAIAAVCIAIALVVWLTPEHWWRGQLLEWADAVGLAAYAVFGTAKALAWGVPPVPALMMGVITGCVGGTIRDILAGVPSIIMRPEVYVTAAALASGLFLLLQWLGTGTPVAAVTGAIAGSHPARRGDPLVACAARLSQAKGLGQATGLPNRESVAGSC